MVLETSQPAISRAGSCSGGCWLTCKAGQHFALQKRGSKHGAALGGVWVRPGAARQLPAVAPKGGIPPAQHLRRGGGSAMERVSRVVIAAGAVEAQGQAAYTHSIQSCWQQQQPRGVGLLTSWLTGWLARRLGAPGRWLACRRAAGLPGALKRCIAAPTPRPATAARCPSGLQPATGG